MIWLITDPIDRLDESTIAAYAREGTWGLEGKQIDLHADNTAFVQTITMDFQDAFPLAGEHACEVVRGTDGEAHAETLEDECWDLLQAQLKTTVTSGSFLVDVDTTGLVAGGSSTTGSHLLNVTYDRAPGGFHTGVFFGFVAGPATVTVDQQQQLGRRVQVHRPGRGERKEGGRRPQQKEQPHNSL